MISFLRGKKSYIVGIGWILWGAWSYAVEGDHAGGVQRIMEGISLIALRAGIAKTAVSTG